MLRCSRKSVRFQVILEQIPLAVNVIPTHTRYLSKVGTGISKVIYGSIDVRWRMVRYMMVVGLGATRCSIR